MDKWLSSFLLPSSWQCPHHGAYHSISTKELRAINRGNKSLDDHGGYKGVTRVSRIAGAFACLRIRKRESSLTELCDDDMMIAASTTTHINNQKDLLTG